MERSLRERGDALPEREADALHFRENARDAGEVKAEATRAMAARGRRLTAKISESAPKTPATAPSPMYVARRPPSKPRDVFGGTARRRRDGAAHDPAVRASEFCATRHDAACQRDPSGVHIGAPKFTLSHVLRAIFASYPAGRMPRPSRMLASDVLRRRCCQSPAFSRWAACKNVCPLRRATVTRRRAGDKHDEGAHAQLSGAEDESKNPPSIGWRHARRGSSVDARRAHRPARNDRV